MSSLMIKLVIISFMLVCICVLLPVLVWCIKSQRAANIEDIAMEKESHKNEAAGRDHQELSECRVPSPLPSPVPSPVPDEEQNNQGGRHESNPDKRHEINEDMKEDLDLEPFQMSLGPSLASVALNPAPIDLAAGDNDDDAFKLPSNQNDHLKLNKPHHNTHISTISSIYNVGPENHPQNTDDTPYLDEGANNSDNDGDGLEGVDEDDLYKVATSPTATNTITTQ